jgi:hypothetical protein
VTNEYIEYPDGSRTMRGVAAATLALALKATGHIAAWIVWHSTRTSLLPDLDAPQPPGQPGRPDATGTRRN